MSGPTRLPVDFFGDTAARFRAARPGPLSYRVVRLPRGMYMIEVTRADGSREIVQRLRTRHDALVDQSRSLKSVS
jgi:hypothetical protein